MLGNELELQWNKGERISLTQTLLSMIFSGGNDIVIGPDQNKLNYSFICFFRNTLVGIEDMIRLQSLMEFIDLLQVKVYYYSTADRESPSALKIDAAPAATFT